MPADLPTPGQTLAVLLGASIYRYAPKLARGPAFYNSSQQFGQYLTEIMGVPEENVSSFFDEGRSAGDQLRDIRDFLEDRADELKNRGTPAHDLIIHYVGHGLFTGGDSDYCLAIRATDERNEGFTSIRMRDLATVIHDSATFMRKYLILDCCFSGAAYQQLQSGPLHAAKVKVRDLLNDESPQRGTSLLCSASAKDPSIAPRGLLRTMFSDSLLNTLTEGNEDFGPRLSMSDIGELVRVRIKETYRDMGVRPEVHSPDQRSGDIARMPLFPNPARTRAAIKEEKAERTTRESAEAQAEAVRCALEKAEAERVEQERAQAEAQRVAREKMEAERLAQERAEAQAKAKRAAREKAKAETLAQERAEAQAKARRTAREKAKAETLAQERAEAQARAERAAREKAEAERLALERAEAQAEAGRAAPERRGWTPKGAQQRAEARLLAAAQAEAEGKMQEEQEAILAQERTIRRQFWICLLSAPFIAFCLDTLFHVTNTFSLNVFLEFVIKLIIWFIAMFTVLAMGDHIDKSPRRKLLAILISATFSAGFFCYQSLELNSDATWGWCIASVLFMWVSFGMKPAKAKV
jgi:hypothetical protein